MSNKLSAPHDLSGSGMILEEYQFQHFEGKVLTLIESFGLKDSQEVAVKSLLKQEIWILFSRGRFISGEQHGTVLAENTKAELTNPSPAGR